MRLLLAILMLAGPVSGAAGLTLFVDSPDALWPSWERAVASHPLPPGTTIERAAPGGHGASDLATLRWTSGSAFKVIEKTVFAAVGKIWDPPGGVTRAQVESGTMPLAPLESIVLPDVALPVDGRFPGEPGYALQEQVGLALESTNSGLREWFETLPSPREPAPVVWIGAVGDVMPARGVDADLEGRPGVPRVFGDVLPVLRSVDVLLGNLEASATRRGARMTKTYTFRFAPEALKDLAAAGFSYLSVTNNHTYDFGSEGFLDTLSALREADIATSGAGRSLREAQQPAELRRAGTDIRVLSFGAFPVDRTGFDGRKVMKAGPDAPGILWLDEEGLSAARQAFSPSTFNIACVHGGQEWSSAPTGEQTRMYRGLIEAGADLVIGTHPHVLQGLEAWKGGLVAYSLGNFLFPGMDGTPGGEDSVILRVGVYEKRIVCVQPIAVRLTRGSVRLATGSAITTKLAGLSVARNREVDQDKARFGG